MAVVQYAPLFALETQFQAKNGRNLTGGFLRVFLAATDDPADTYSDYKGTRNPDNIVIDDDGRAVVICDKSKAYRLEVYDADGMLMWTEEPVFCSGSGGAGVSSSTDIISTDGTIVVEKSTAGSSTTFDIGLGVDMDRLNPSCLSADATPRNSDGKFVFGELSKEGDLLSVDNYGCVRCEPAWYHFTAIVELSYDQVATNSSHQITLYTTLSNSVVDFDLSYAHRESIELSGDIHVVESNSEFVLGVTGLPNGVTASLVDFDIHAITGHEQSAEYTAGNGINIADHVISADLDVVQHKLTAGQNITITGNVISAENLSQEQADWTQQDSEEPSFIKHKPDLSIYATTSTMETALAGKQDVISDLSTIRSGAAAGATALQPSALDDYSTTQEMNTALAAKQDVISDLSAIRSGAQAGATALQPSALDDYSTTQEMNTALAAKQDVISDLSTIRSGAALGATAIQPADMNTALAGKQDVISDLATIRSGAALGASSVQPNDLATVATTGDYDDLVDKPDLSVYAESANLATVATTGDYADLTNRPSIPTKTSDLTNDSGFITDADVPVKDVEVDGVSVVNALGTAEIDLSGYATTSVMNTALAGKQDTISDLSTIRSGAAAGATAVQPGDLATVATTGDYNDLSNKPSIPAAQINADWNASSGVAEILNKPQNLVQDASYVHTDNNFTNADVNKLNGIAAGAEVNVQSNWSETDTAADSYIQNKPAFAAVAMTGSYADLSNTPTIPVVDQTYDASSTNAQSGVAVAQALAGISVDEVPPVTSADDGKVLTADYTGSVGSYSWEAPQNQVPASTPADYGKVLTVNDVGGLSWEAYGESGSLNPGYYDAPAETLRLRFGNHNYDPTSQSYASKFDSITRVSDGVYDFSFANVDSLALAAVFSGAFTDFTNNPVDILGMYSTSAYSTTPRSFRNMFAGCTGLRSIWNMKSLIGSRVDNRLCFYGMFDGCSNLVEVHSREGQLAVINMESGCRADRMFFGCTSLRICDLEFSGHEGYGTPRPISSMASTFMRCTSLTFPPMITGYFSSFQSCFAECSSLKSFSDNPLYIERAPVIGTPSSSGVSFYEMFSGCRSLSDMRLFNLASFGAATSIYGLFADCSKLEYAPPINIGIGCNAEGCFDHCVMLPETPNWDYSTITSAKRMFDSCVSLRTIGSNVTGLATSATDVDSLFIRCISVETGVLDCYNALAASSIIQSHTDTFRYTGMYSGNDQRSSIPASWGGTAT